MEKAAAVEEETAAEEEPAAERSQQQKGASSRVVPGRIETLRQLCHAHPDSFDRATNLSTQLA